MGKTRVTVAEDTPATETENEWIAEMKQIHGERLLINNVSDIDLLRFSRAFINDENPKETTFKTVAEYLQWREDDKIDQVASTEFERYVDFVKLWPCGFSGIDKSNHPIYFDCIGQMDPSSFAKSFEPGEYEKIHIQMMESLQDIKVALSERLGRPVYKHTVVIDLEGMGLKHVWDRAAMSKLIELDSSKYPETLNKMLIINPPFMFKAIYAIFSGFLDATTQSRIHVLKSPAELLQHIDPSQLPEKYGGLIKYPADTPLFSLPFQTAEGSESQFDDLFRDLLPKRQRRLAAIQAKIAADKAATDAAVPVDDVQTSNQAMDDFLSDDEITKVEDNKIAQDKAPEDQPIDDKAPENQPVDNQTE